MIEERLFDLYLLEDTFPADVTSAIIPENKIVVAKMISKSKGIVAGIKVIKHLLERKGLSVELHKNDGEEITPGDTILTIRGPARLVLTLERTVLNIVMRMSGIATQTRMLVEMVHKINPAVRIAATRKTTPGFRYFEKMAVEIGGGDTHRFNLADMVLIKDNHIKILGGIENALSVAKSSVSFSKKVEIEVRTKEEAITAAKCGADIIMLDNFSPEQIRETLAELKRLDLRNHVIIEASGGITPQNIEEYAKTGVDVISLGYLTHSVKSLDISLKIIKVEECESKIH